MNDKMSFTLCGPIIRFSFVCVFLLVASICLVITVLVSVMLSARLILLMSFDDEDDILSTVSSDDDEESSQSSCSNNISHLKEANRGKEDNQVGFLLDD